MKKFLVLPILLTSTVAFADYQFQVTGSQTSTDFEGPAEASRTGLTLEAYVNAIDAGTAPFAESGFLSKQSTLFFNYNFGDRDFGSGREDELKGYSVGARIVSENNLFFGFALGREDTKLGNTFGVELTEDHISLSIGQYTSDTTAIRFSYTEQDYEETDRFGSRFSSDSHDFQLDVKSVTPTANSGHISAFGFIRKIDDEGLDFWSSGFSSTYYPNQQLGIGLGFSFSDSDFVDVAILTLGTSYFFTEQAALEFSIKRQNTEFANDIDANDIDIDIFSMGIAARF